MGKEGYVLTRPREGRAFKYIRDTVTATHPEATIQAVLEKYRWLAAQGFPIISMEERAMVCGKVIQMPLLNQRQLLTLDHALPTDLRKPSSYEQLYQEILTIAVETFHHGNGVYLSADAYAVEVDEFGLARVLLLDIGVGSYRLQQGQSSHSRGAIFTEQNAILQAKFFLQETIKHPEINR